jgi:hypothetical protein
MNEQEPSDPGGRLGSYWIPYGGGSVATQRSKSAPAKKRTHVSASVKLDVATNARVAAAAALAGIDKSTWMSRAIVDALQGIVVFDRRKGADQVDSSSGEESAS